MKSTLLVLGLLTLAACSDDSETPVPRKAPNGAEATGQQPAPPAGEAVDASAPPGPAPTTPPPPFTPSPPVEVGLGVTYQQVGTGAGVFIAYGGYTAEIGHTQAWAAELVRATLSARGVGHVYAVQGPQEPDYASLEIGNSKLRAHLGGPIAGGAPFIFVAAHSSGSYVAHELLQQLDVAGDDATLGKIVYANLDGGEAMLDSAIAGKLRRAAFVYARDPGLDSGLSANADMAVALGEKYASKGASFEVAVQGSGCESGAEWCLHDLVITHRPHKADTFDVAADYTDFANRAVTTEYIEALATYLK